MGNVYYLVENGRCPGIYTNWPACQRQVDKFSGAVYRKITESEAISRGLIVNDLESQAESVIGDFIDIEDLPPWE